MPRKIAFLGGGGVRTPLVVFGINESAKQLDAEELVLYDVDRERVEMIARLGREDVGPAVRRFLELCNGSARCCR